ncbi:hypothetical protein C8A00DRAFT_40643 [Chaetomidium leptoderma]|uniref:Sec20 C-terminal domain-containing protein n=1 Tax=Chaetomidium leptoderma TaxID=669021 RepID=A0AAN7A0I8_9PEZI|nr:hypothetical protein C8A00DRAFT_40643 [Chaetomidium leptoderma]
MSFESLQERLAALQETTSQLKDLIDRLANIKFHPGSVPLSTSDEDNVATELNTEISQILREEDEDLELLQEEIIDLRSGRPGSDVEHRKTRLKDGAQRLQTELKTCRTEFRKAQLAARRSLDAAQKLERDLLLASYAASASASSSTILSNPDDTTPPSQNHSGATSLPPNPSGDHQQQDEETARRNQLFTPRDRRRHNNKKDSHLNKDGAGNVVTASNDITLALRRTHTLIAGELAKSAFASQTLAESSAALADLQQSYAGLDGLLTRSRDLVGTLVSAQKSDTWYLQTALRLLLATLAWLVFRRFLYGPLWWLVWLPLRTGWRVTKGVTSSGVGGESKPAAVGKMGVVAPGEERATVVVGVGEEGAVPTVWVGRETAAATAGKVGRMVEDTLDRRRDEEEANRTAEEELDDQPNPMKRMWEEEEEEEEVWQEAEGVRDEL